MLGKIIIALSALALARAQIPSLGFCPEYIPMANFDMGKFLGTWYEAERYFQISELVSRCVKANYTKGLDGKFRVSNEVTNRLTGVKRVLDGEIKASSIKTEEGKLHVKYTTLPFTLETKYSVLETDYKSYAVMWSCSGFGPVHTQNAWIMTRERLAPGEVLQKAYGVLDKYKISKTFFVKTDQDECAYLENITPSPPVENPPQDEVAEQSRYADVPNVTVNTKKIEIEKKTPEVLVSPALPQVESEISVEASEPVIINEKKDDVPAINVPELILKVADQAKEVVETPIKGSEQTPKENPKEQENLTKV